MQDGFVEHAQKQRRRGRSRFLNLVEQHQGQIAVAADRAERTCVSSGGLAMADIPRRGADQFGDFVVRLVLAQSILTRCLALLANPASPDGPGLAAPVAQQQKDTGRPIG